MKQNKNTWNKKELQTYILLLCANADSDETNEELNLIKSKVDTATFEKINAEFKGDTEEDALLKINANVQRHEYSHTELSQIWKEMHQIFTSDHNITMVERNLDRILGNIIY